MTVTSYKNNNKNKISTLFILGYFMIMMIMSPNAVGAATTATGSDEKESVVNGNNLRRREREERELLVPNTPLLDVQHDVMVKVAYKNSDRMSVTKRVMLEILKSNKYIPIEKKNFNQKLETNDIVTWESGLIKRKDDGFIIGVTVEYEDTDGRKGRYYEDIFENLSAKIFDNNDAKAHVCFTSRFSEGVQRVKNEIWGEDGNIECY